MRTPAGEGPVGVGQPQSPATHPMSYVPTRPMAMHTCLDHVVPQPDDEGVGPICLKLLPELIQDLVELGQVPGPDGCGTEETEGEGSVWALVGRVGRPGGLTLREQEVGHE